MQTSLIIFAFLMISTLIILAFTGIMIVLKGMKNKSLNLHLLGISIVLMSLMMLIIMIIQIWWIYHLINMVSHILLLFFIKKTFNVEKKYTFKIILIICIIISISSIGFSLVLETFQIIERTIFTRFITIILEFSLSMIVFIWYGKKAYISYKILKSQKIDAWVIVRLKIISISSFIFAFIYAPEFIRLDPSISAANFDNPIIFLNLILTFIFVFIFTISQYFAWVMPKWYKKNLMNGKEINSLNGIGNDISEGDIYRLLMEDSKDA